ncbi:oxysterol-binding protein-related protein 1-like protein [Dinothrombium tinctorium]|uniref:Oxysterol-binding protein n=2 Tax=Dinothrombium tinctorium TaxID=1965070 RepID=A0A3S3PWI9_9ACAR|nr:oxysterol-binding protein-related protein 1-like protein [Dinothrombium tinctorium]
MVPRSDISIWSILRHCIGKELSRITIPVHFNEPLSFLQRISENLEYAELLDKADKCADPVQRMEYVATFAVASLSYNLNRLFKPFNPLLGETFELINEKLDFRLIAEQVSHHPPISATHTETPNWVFSTSVQPKLRFWGKFVEIKPEGLLTLKMLNYNESYTWRSVNSCVHNIIIGQLWFEQYGNMEIINHANGLRAVLNFKPAGWFGKDLHRVEGFILSRDNVKLRFIYGKWTDYLKSADVEDYNEYMKNNENRFRIPDQVDTDEGKKSPSSGNSSPTSRKMFSKFSSIKKSLTGSSSSLDIPDASNGNLPPPLEYSDGIPKSDSSHSLDIPNSKVLWRVNQRPEYSADYYHFTLNTMSLNEFREGMKKYLPPTDCRLRPDVRALEEGDLEKAANLKHLLEEKQRETRKMRKKRKEEWHPMWFKRGKNTCTNEDDWIFTGKYWERNYSDCPNIFDISI